MEAKIAALGCLLPFVLLVLGAVGGALVGGTSGAYWGCGIGLLIGLAIGLAALGWWERLRSRWQ